MKKELYLVWGSMIQRCTNQKRDSWKFYGGRGVKVCERWRTFANFAEDMFPRPPGTTLDRIDPNGNYEKSNCRWATPKEQAFTKRKKIVEHCSNCGESTLASSGEHRSWHGLCHACNEYKRRNKIDRPKDKSKISELASLKIRKNKRPIYGISLSTGERIDFDFQADAIKIYGNGVNHCLRKKVKSAKGYIWEYGEKNKPCSNHSSLAKAS